MTASVVPSAPSPRDESSPSQECSAAECFHASSSSSPAGAAFTPVVAFEPISVHEVYHFLIEHRAAVHAAVAEQRAAGAAVNVPYDAVFLCELAGLVVDLETGLVDGLADGRVAPIPALRRRLAAAGFAVCDEVVAGGAAAAA